MMEHQEVTAWIEDKPYMTYVYKNNPTHPRGSTSTNCMAHVQNCMMES